MKQVDSQQLLHDLKALTEKLKKEVQDRFLSLNEGQLAWRPRPESWSINDCLAHLNKYARYYNKVIRNKIEESTEPPQSTFTSSHLGRTMYRTMKLGKKNNIRKKMRAPKGYNPLQNPEIIGQEPVAEFIRHQESLIDLLSKAKETNLKKVKVPISISKIIKLRLGDAFAFIIYHNERHVQQANNVMSNPNFPKT